MKNDINKLTLGELAKVEELSGQSMISMDDPNKPKAKLYQALVFVMKKREDKNFQFKDTESMTFDDLSEFLGVGDDEEVDADPFDKTQED